MNSKTIKEIDFSCDTGVLVKVSKKRLEELGVLEEYIQRRGRNVFEDKEYDYLQIIQAELLGIINYEFSMIRKE